MRPKEDLRRVSNDSCMRTSDDTHAVPEVVEAAEESWAKRMGQWETPPRQGELCCPVALSLAAAKFSAIVRSVSVFHLRLRCYHVAVVAHLIGTPRLFPKTCHGPSLTCFLQVLVQRTRQSTTG